MLMVRRASLMRPVERSDPQLGGPELDRRAEATCADAVTSPGACDGGMAAGFSSRNRMKIGGVTLVQLFRLTLGHGDPNFRQLEPDQRLAEAPQGFSRSSMRLLKDADSRRRGWVALRRVAEAQLAAVGLRDLQAVRQAGALLLDVGDVARRAALLPARRRHCPRHRGQRLDGLLRVLW